MLKWVKTFYCWGAGVVKIVKDNIYISDTSSQQDFLKKLCLRLLQESKPQSASCPCYGSGSWSIRNVTNRMIFEQRPGEGDGCPIDDLEEGDEAEAKAKSKEAAKWGDELDHSHPYAALHLYQNQVTQGTKCCVITIYLYHYQHDVLWPR